MPGYVGYESEYDLGGISYIDDSKKSIVRNGLVLYVDAANKNSYSSIRENLVSHSTYNATAWSNFFPAGATITTGIDAPDGSSTAVRFAANGATSALLRVTIPSFTPNGMDIYTLSFYVRKISGTGNVVADLADNLPSVNYTSQLITNQWVRVTASGIPTSTVKSFIDIYSDATTNHVLDFWGLQLEKNSNATDYVPTNGSAIARGTTWFDLSGSGNHGAIVGGVSYNSSEKFLNFDGINGYVDFGSASAGSDSSNFTFSAWFKNITPGTISYVLLRGTDGLGAGWSLRIAVQADLTYRTASVTTSPSTVPNNVNSTPSVVENSWVNITGVWINGVSMSQYINGVLQSTVNFSGMTLRSSTTGWVAGRASTTLYSRLNLAVAHVYNRALSQSEILQNFNATRGRYGI